MRSAFLFFFCSVASSLSEVTLSPDFVAGGQDLKLEGPHFKIEQGHGKTLGSNLFHSFQEFSLTNTETATFSGAPEIQNVIARVTGDGLSIINGMIVSEIAYANLILMNPKGIMFGAEGEVDVTGAFTATTADYVEFEDGTKFHASEAADDALLSVASPQAFGFLSSSGSIVLSETERLAPEGNNHSRHIQLVARNVYLKKGAKIISPNGTVKIASVGVGEVVDADIDDYDPSAPDQGLIELEADSHIDTSSTLETDVAGGGIVIRGGQLLMEKAVLSSNTRSGIGKGIDVNASEKVTLNNESYITSNSRNEGVGGPVKIVAAQTVDLSNNSAITLESFGNKRGGNLTIQADMVTLANSNISSIGRKGTGGDVTVEARTKLILKENGRLAATARGTGSGGIMTVSGGSVEINGDDSSNFTGIDLANSGSGKGGELKFDLVGDLIITGGGIIESTASGEGQGGDISGTVSSLFIDGKGLTVVDNDGSVAPQLTGIRAGSTAAGDSGEIDLVVLKKLTIQGNGLIDSPAQGGWYGLNLMSVSDDADIVDAGESLVNVAVLGGDLHIKIFDAQGQLVVNKPESELESGQGLTDFKDLLTGIPFSDETELSSEARWEIIEKAISISGHTPQGSGNGGNITLSAESALIDGQNLGFFNGITGFAEKGSGNSGHINVTVSGLLELMGGGLIDTSTFMRSTGTAGDVMVHAKHLLIDKTGTDRFTGIGSDSDGTGQGGTVTVTGHEWIKILGGGLISTASFQSGNAGEVEVTAGELLIDGKGLPHKTVVTEFSAITSQGNGSGNAGSVQATTTGNAIKLSNGGLISSEGKDTGQAGDVTIASATDIRLSKEAALTVAGAKARGGVLMLIAQGDIIVVDGSVITASSRGSVEADNGGNVSIDGQTVFLISDSHIVAKAQAGNGGEILLGEGTLVQANGSVVSVSSDKGAPGSVQVESTINLTDAIPELEEGEALAAEDEVANLDPSKVAEDQSTFIPRGGRGGIRHQPGDFMPSLIPLSLPDED